VVAICLHPVDDKGTVQQGVLAHCRHRHGVERENIDVLSVARRLVAKDHRRFGPLPVARASDQGD
jgi:hypothetical protein